MRPPNTTESAPIMLGMMNDFPYFTPGAFDFIKQNDTVHILKCLAAVDQEMLDRFFFKISYIYVLSSGEYLEEIKAYAVGTKKIEPQKWDVVFVAFLQVVNPSTREDWLQAIHALPLEDVKISSRREESEEEPRQQETGHPVKKDSTTEQTTKKGKSVEQAGSRSKANVKSNSNSSKQYQYVSYENSVFLKPKTPKVNGLQWFGDKTLTVTKGVFALSNALAIRRFLVSLLLRTSLKIWAIHIVSVSTAVAASMAVWQGLTWLQSRFFRKEVKKIVQNAVRVPAKIIGVDKVNQTVNLQLNNQKIQVPYGVGKSPARADSFAKNIDKYYQESKEQLEEKDRREVVLHLDQEAKLHSLSF